MKENCKYLIINGENKGPLVLPFQVVVITPY